MGSLTRDAGSARLSVEGPVGYTPDGRETWRYTIAEVTRFTGLDHDRVVREDVRVLETGADLHSGVGMVATPEQMMSTLCAFLTAGAEASAWAMRTGTALEDTENGTLFPHRVLMLAEQESDEIAMLGVELDEEENDG